MRRATFCCESMAFFSYGHWYMLKVVHHFEVGVTNATSGIL